METVFILGAFQSFFFAFFLLTKRQNHLANVFMGIWLIVLGLSFIDYWVVASETYLKYPHLSGIFSGTPLLHGPLFFLYVYFLFNPRKGRNGLLILHFVPFILYYLHGSFTFFTENQEEKIEMMNALNMGEAPLYLTVWSFIKSFHGAAYMFWINIRLNAEEKRMEEGYSNLEKIRIKWLHILNISLLGIYLFAVLNNFLVLFLNLNLEIFLGLFSMVLILTGGFFAMRQAALFKGPAPEVTKKSTETPKNFSQLHEKVIRLMEEEKPYLNPDLTLAEFATALDVAPKELSKVLNEGFQQNFFTFVNSYRVKEVKEQIQDPRNAHITLLGIGYQSGFNSKTTFNTVFKKLAGQTPSQYKRSISD